MKTLFMFEIILEGLNSDFIFFELEGDHSCFDGVYVNDDSLEDSDDFSKESKLERDLFNIVYEEEADIAVKILKQPTKDWDFFVRCGVIF